MPSNKTKVSKISFFYRPNDKRAQQWKDKISAWLKTSFPRVKIADKGFQVLVVLGGDGTILQAARTCQENKALVLGLNLGTVGFLASVRSQKGFFQALEKLFKGEFHITERGMLLAKVLRNGKSVLSTNALNEIVVLNALGMVDIKVLIDGHPLQYIKGTGVMVATATGSTAYNLSAHGPLVMPESKSIILTELLDHNIPTPSIVLSEAQEVVLHIAGFRKRELLSITKTREKADVLFVADGEIIHPLKKNDSVKVTRSPARIRFVEFEKNYFLKSLRDKFAFQ